MFDLGGDKLEDIDINMIDFEWVKKTTSVKSLKKALKILIEDGNFPIKINNFIIISF